MDKQIVERGQQLCSLCFKQLHSHELVSITLRCPHKFCSQCLARRLQQSLHKNEDMRCPNDACPHLLSQESQFFKALFSNLREDYLKWKISEDYRPPSFRLTQNFNDSEQKIEFEEDKPIEEQFPKEQMQLDRPLMDPKPKKIPIFIIILKIILGIFGIVGLLLMGAGFIIICIGIYLLGIIFVCLSMVSFVGLIVFAIKQSYFICIFCFLLLVFSVVATKFYASNISQINKEIIKAGFQKLHQFNKRIIDFCVA